MGFHRPSDGLSAIIPTILASRSSHVSAGMYALRPFYRLRRSDGRSKGCMHCMHQKADYACYAETQLRKRLHTMHTRKQFGSGVRLRGQKCMHLRMHTKCIQNAYKHIKRGKERNSSLLLLIPPVFLSSTARVYRQSNFFLFASSGMDGYRRTIRITHQASLPVLLGRGQSQFTTNHLAHELYALYASKNRLCMLCGNTTPKKTAYNAYRNANRRVRRG